ncbi:hypothetical protein DER45DRAFT_606629 [Fusarium avenaceum]|nr:hypothetical protein DER45DRAFT_606629 [Fusarium avenaceum]
MSPPLVGLGQVYSTTPLSSDNINTDPLPESIKNGLSGGGGTANYFKVANGMGGVFQQLIQNGRKAWLEGTDANDLPVYFVESMENMINKQYFNMISVKGLNIDDNGNVQVNGTTTVINGVTYDGIGVLQSTLGWDDYTLSETSWWLGVSINGDISLRMILGPIKGAVRAVADAIGDAIYNTTNDPTAGEGGTNEQETSDEEASIGEEYISKVRKRGCYRRSWGAPAWGDVFIGASVAPAVVFVVLPFALQNTTQYARVWNLTQYKLVWVIQFNKPNNTDDGQLAIGPVVFDSNNNITAYEPLNPVNSTPASPGEIPPPTAQYSDMIVQSSSQDAGIGYVLQYQMQDPDSGETVYTGTVYFNIPLNSDNSTNVTFDSVPNLQDWYNQNQGNNEVTLANATTPDGKVTFFTTYDYLSGEHPAPQITPGSPNSYYYQSLIVFLENDLTAASKTAPKALPTQLLMGNPFDGIHPSIRQKVLRQQKALQVQKA